MLILLNLAADCQNAAPRIPKHHNCGLIDSMLLHCLADRTAGLSNPGMMNTQSRPILKSRWWRDFALRDFSTADMNRVVAVGHIREVGPSCPDNVIDRIRYAS